MTISKALKRKNVLVKEISTLVERISSYNSYLSGTTPTYNAVELLGELKAKTNELIKLKSDLNKANQPIQESIYKISELKSFISRIKNINTTAGKQISGRFSATTGEVEYFAQISTLQLDALVKASEVEVDELQEKIDTFNYTTTI